MEKEFNLKEEFSKLEISNNNEWNNIKNNFIYFIVIFVNYKLYQHINTATFPNYYAVNLGFYFTLIPYFYYLKLFVIKAIDKGITNNKPINIKFQLYIYFLGFLIIVIIFITIFNYLSQLVLYTINHYQELKGRSFKGLVVLYFTSFPLFIYIWADTFKSLIKHFFLMISYEESAANITSIKLKKVKKYESLEVNYEFISKNNELIKDSQNMEIAQVKKSIDNDKNINVIYNKKFPKFNIIYFERII